MEVKKKGHGKKNWEKNLIEGNF